MRTNRSIPDTCKDGNHLTLTLMEEKLMNEWGLREMTSSELQLRGGADKSKLATILEKIRNLLDTIMDYIPNLLKGFKDGFLCLDRDND